MGKRPPAPRHNALVASFASIVLALSAVVIALTADAWYLALVPLLMIAGAGGFMFKGVSSLRDDQRPSGSE
ncbi:hypothetical protein [Arthrobacter pigmenti]